MRIWQTNSNPQSWNNLHPKLKFEIEKPEITPNGHSLSLLDFKVTISKDGRSSFEFYKTTAKKPMFVHHQSAIPKTSKINFIRNERKRIEDKCSTKTTARKHQNNFDDVLRLNGYPESIIDQTKHSQKDSQKDPRPLSTEWLYLEIPYISERLNYRITSIFRKEGIPVRVAHGSYTPSQTSSLSQQQGTDMHEGQLSYLRHQIVLISQCCSPNHVQQLQPTLHREHYTLYPRWCKRTSEQ